MGITARVRLGNAQLSGEILLASFFIEVIRVRRPGELKRPALTFSDPQDRPSAINAMMMTMVAMGFLTLKLESSMAAPGQCAAEAADALGWMAVASLALISLTAWPACSAGCTARSTGPGFR